MNKEFSREDFDDVVKLFKMTPSYQTLSRGGKLYILETWQTDVHALMKMVRMIEFTKENLSNIDPKKRKTLLQQILDDLVENEEYEQAATIRDLIAEICLEIQ